MPLTNYNRPDWEDVFTEAAAVRKLEPWHILDSERPFKVESPYGEQAGWCSLMGGGGTVFGLNIYLGHEGFTAFHRLYNSSLMGMPDYFRHTVFFSQPLIQVEFVNASELEKSDRAKHKALGLSASGWLNGIKIRKHLPGQSFGELDDEDLPFVADCLEQCQLVMDLVDEDGVLPGTYEEENKYLIRRGVETGSDVEYTSYVEEAPDDAWRYNPQYPRLEAVIEREVAGLPRSSKMVLYHMQYMPSIVRANKKSKAYRPLCGLFLDKGTAFAHPPELFHYANLPNNFAARFCRQLRALGYLPATIVVSVDLAVDVLQPVTSALGITLEQHPEYPEFEEFGKGLYETVLGE